MAEPQATPLEQFTAAVASRCDARGAAFDAKVLAAAAGAQRRDPAAFVALKDAVRHAGIPLREWNASVKLAAAAQASAREAAAATNKPDALIDPDGRLTIRVDTNEPRVIGELAAALAGRDDLYQRGGQLVRPVRDARAPEFLRDGEDVPRIVPLAIPALRETAARAARFYTWKYNALTDAWTAVDVHPPDWAIRALEARREWRGIRVLEGVTECPVLLPSGKVLDAPGYDRASGLLYTPTQPFERVHAWPTRDAARAAATQLLELLADFPFATEAHRGAALAAMLTPFARFAFSGPAPLMLIDKSAPGTGGSLLADVIGVLATGRPLPRMAQARDDDEERKRITTLAMGGTSLVLIDNIAGPLGSPSLDAALTGTDWRDRALGSNTEVCVPLRLTFYGTGNNVEITGDLARRCLHIRMESRDELPEQRTGFRIPNLLAHVRRNRGALVHAAVTLLAAFAQAKYPGADELPPWGSFDDWSRIVRGAVVWAGVEDPGATRLGLREQADATIAALPEFVAGWAEVCASLGGPATARQVLDVLAANDAAAASPYTSERRQWDTLRGALADLLGLPAGRLPTAKKLGYVLRKYRGRIIGGRAVVPAGEDRNGVVRWRVDGATAGYAGYAGLVSTRPCREVENSKSRGENLYGGETAPASPASPASPAAHNCERHGTDYRPECGLCGEHYDPARVTARQESARSSLTAAVGGGR
jgi:hypothetical protein